MCSVGEFLILSFHKDTARNYEYIYKQNKVKQQFFYYVYSTNYSVSFYKSKNSIISSDSLRFRR